MSPRLITLLLLSTGCQSVLSDHSFATGSHTVVADSDRGLIWAVDADNGAIVRQSTSGEVHSVDVGVEPSRIARAGSRLFVTLRGERSVAVLEDKGDSLKLLQKVEVGTEPYGIVAREDGKRLYVALATQGVVQELDGESFSVLRSWEISGEPTWLALQPGGHALYIASAFGGTLSWVDLDNGNLAAVDLPTLTGAGEERDQPLTRRLTGDMWVSSDGDTLALPGLYVDNITPVGDPTEDGSTDVDAGGGYASTPSLNISRMNPAVITVPLKPGGKPEIDGVANLFAGGFGLDNTVRSYLNSVTISPDGETVFATMEASGTVVAMSLQPLFADAGDTDVMMDMVDTGGSGIQLSTEAAGFASAPTVVISTDMGPRGVAFVGDDAYVHNFLSRSIGKLWNAGVEATLADMFVSGSLGMEAAAAPKADSFGDSLLDPTVLQGRELFYSATASVMAADGAGVSCSTCHYDGRNDGLTWTFTNGVRQTPSLAGQVSLTAPVTWNSAVASVGSEATITSQGRMGGSDISDAQVAAIAAFVDFGRHMDLPNKGSTAADVLRGKAIFEREDVACASCHVAPLYTDNANHTMFGLDDANTPTLVGIAASAPYMHDGSAATLRDVLVMSRSGEMGDTSMLSDAEIADLEAFLYSL